MSFNCPECGLPTNVLSTRTSLNSVTRRRGCSAGHRNTTKEFWTDRDPRKKWREPIPALREAVMKLFLKAEKEIQNETL